VPIDRGGGAGDADGRVHALRQCHAHHQPAIFHRRAFVDDPAGGGHVALRPLQIAQVRHEWGFDKPVYVQYLKTMGKILNGTVVSYSQGVNVLDSIRQGLPATLSLAIGAGPPTASS